MDIEALWEKARDKTEFVRGRVKGLSTFSSTDVPYVFLAESAVNEGSTVVRKGKIIVERPMIVLPHDMPQFDGFEFEEDLGLSQELIQTFFLMRGIRFPSLKYNNTISNLDLSDKSLLKTIDIYKKGLEKKENISTALIVGPEDCWQISVLLYVASLAGRCARNDIETMIDKINGE